MSSSHGEGKGAPGSGSCMCKGTKRRLICGFGGSGRRSLQTFSVWRRLGHDGRRQEHRQDAVAEVQAGAYSAVSIEEVLLWAGRHLMEA